MKIGLLGDIHGDKSWMKFAAWKFNQAGITKVIQVGDFGIYQDQHSLDFLKISELLAQKYNITWYVVPGNHEDWNWINQLHDEKGTPDEWTPLRRHILLAPRGLRWEWDGVKFVALAGAPSVDRGWRVRADAKHPNAKNPLWHAGEAITQADVDNVVAGGYADVMIGHDAPMGVPTIDHNISSNPHGFETADLLYAADGRRLMHEAYRGVAPLTFVHGHYHFKVNDMIRRPGPHSDLESEREQWTNVVGLACNGGNFSLGSYDTETKEATTWDTNKDHYLYLNEGVW